MAKTLWEESCSGLLLSSHGIRADLFLFKEAIFDRNVFCIGLWMGTYVKAHVVRRIEKDSPREWMFASNPQKNMARESQDHCISEV